VIEKWIQQTHLSLSHVAAASRWCTLHYFETQLPEEFTNFKNNDRQCFDLQLAAQSKVEEMQTSNSTIQVGQSVSRYRHVSQTDKHDPKSDDVAQDKLLLPFIQCHKNMLPNSNRL
jgi:hypothetical protein